MSNRESNAPVVGRRTLAKGAAWTVPAVVAVGVAPTASASPQPDNALDGLFYVGDIANRSCSNNNKATSTIDGRSSYIGASGPPYLQVNGTTAAQTITSVCIRFGFTISVSGFTRNTGDNGRWSTPAQDGTMSYGSQTYYMYKSCLADPMPTAVLGNTPVTAGFYFTATFTGCPGISNVNAIAQRVVVITQPPNYTPPGQTITWVRGVADIN
ncbi:hypothetical protein [Yimella sp. cx-51]|uniref:hypothetical protein n=1 Tax=Yimella sp. cx-51 TaxID=2770551 RepID=UPI00165E80AA|nr:hypothetical protein [Yimella sp. cx-51]MBC9958211.1 hypothetical protein [Yimella sp. cx-51]QTH38756.1 hypothetical protein J5M86_03705 [Yimella sp. cx-51]